MPTFSARSLAQLETCDPRLQQVAHEVIKHFDHTILEGHRGQEAQDQAVAKGLSQVAWPHGRHNSRPSRAMDVAPYPIDWTERETARQRFVYLAGMYVATGLAMGIRLRWGGDWNNDRDTRDERFRDLPHLELIDP